MSDSYEQEVVKMAKVVTPRVDPRTQASDIFDDWGSVFEGPHNWLDDVKPGALIKMLYERKILVGTMTRKSEFLEHLGTLLIQHQTERSPRSTNHIDYTSSLRKTLKLTKRQKIKIRIKLIENYYYNSLRIC